jgi:nitroimidazol reductase NimA-like FMN-containing flavoprotein (pyridoxamine 5'-phosphate oxidase superfamily)
MVMLIQEMTEAECYEVLARTRLGRLACASENQPYVVAVYVVYHASTTGEPSLYGFTTPGQKVEWMRANPRVCVEFDEVTSHDRWLSVVVFGHYDELPDTRQWEQERVQAHRLLQEYASWWEPGSAVHAARPQHPPARPISPVFYRIRIDRVTGHRAQPDSGVFTGPACQGGDSS